MIEQTTMIKVGDQNLTVAEAISFWECSMKDSKGTLPYLKRKVLDPNTDEGLRKDLLELIEYHSKEIGKCEALVKEAKSK